MSVAEVHCSLPGARISSTVRPRRGNRRRGPRSRLTRRIAIIFCKKGRPDPGLEDRRNDFRGEATSGGRFARPRLLPWWQSTIIDLHTVGGRSIHKRIGRRQVMTPITILALLSILAILGLPVLIVILLFATGKLSSSKPPSPPGSSCGGWTLPDTRYCPHYCHRRRGRHQPEN